jgi:hypothetical protein
MKDSLQHVHSNPCSHTTGMRGFVSIADTTFGNIDDSRPMAAAVVTQNFKKSRRSTPCSRNTSYVVRSSEGLFTGDTPSFGERKRRRTLHYGFGEVDFR